MSIKAAVKATALLAAMFALGLMFIFFIHLFNVAIAVCILLCAVLWYAFYKEFK